MPPLILAIHPNPDALLRDAADAAHGYRLDGILLALRQGGLRDDLHQLAGATNHPGWFDPPACVFDELPARLGSTTRLPLSPDERLVLLDQLIQTHGGPVFSRLKRRLEFVDPIDILIGELVAEGVSPEQFLQAVEQTPTTEAWDRDRNQGLATIYQAWHEALLNGSALPRRDGRDTLIDVANFTNDNPDALAQRLHGRTELRIVGLADLRGGWRILLQALRNCPVLTRITIHTLDNHLVEFEGLEPDETIRPVPSAPAEPQHLTVLQAPDTDREVEEIAVRVRRLLDQGVAAHRIAVVSRDARPHAELMLAALKRVGAPVTARRRISYREIPAIRAVLALLQAAAEGWTRHGLAELASQPILSSQLDARLIDLLGFRRAVAGLDSWHEALNELVAESTARAAGELEDDYRGWTPPPERATQARDQFKSFAAMAAPLDAQRTLTAWIGWLEEFLASDPWQMEQRIRQVSGEWEVARLDLTGWLALTTAIAQWRNALEAWGGDDTSLDVASFTARLAGVLRGDATLWTSCRRGVQVMEGFAAAYRHFDHLFLLGLEAGSFPATQPRSPVLHQADRAALRTAGLPLNLSDTWEARERSLFHALRLGGAHVTLSHARLDAAGREVVPSVFLDDATANVTRQEIPPGRVLTPGLPLFADPLVAGRALHAANVERLRDTSRLSPWNGQIEDPALRAVMAERFGEGYMWSPTQLEGYAKCPWSWFSSRVLGLEEQTEPEAEIDPAVRGTIWHAALEQFWGSAMAKLHADKRTGEALMLRTSDLTWATPMLSQALDAAWQEAGQEAWLGHPALHEVTREALRTTLTAYLEWEADYNDDAIGNAKTNAFKFLRTAVSAHERRFRGMVLERNGVRFQYRGSIDRVEVGVDERIPDADRYVAAVDYKSGIYSTPGGGAGKAWLDNVVLQVPLYAHAIAQLEGKEVARTEYRAIRQQKTAHSLPLVKFKKAGKEGYVLEADPAAATKLDAALDAAAAHVARVRNGEYPAQTVDSCKCPTFCHAWDICRIAGGPQSSW